MCKQPHLCKKKEKIKCNCNITMVLFGLIYWLTVVPYKYLILKVNMFFQVSESILHFNLKLARVKMYNWQWKLLATWKTLPKVDPHYNFYLHVHGSFWQTPHTWPVCKPGAGLSTQTMRAPIMRWGWLLWQPVQERNWVQQPSSSLHMLFKGTPVIENKQCISCSF